LTKETKCKLLNTYIYREGDYYVSQYLNIDISSFGNNVQETIDNLKDLVDLYFEVNDEIKNTPVIGETMLAETYINA